MLLARYYYLVIYRFILAEGYLRKFKARNKAKCVINQGEKRNNSYGITNETKMYKSRIVQALIYIEQVRILKH